MAIPSSYTDTTLAQYMLSALEGVGGLFEWNTASFAEQINDVLIACSATSVSAVTDVTKLRTLAAYYAWRKALHAGSVRWIDNSVSTMTGGTDRRNQQQIWEHVQQAYRESEMAASAYLPANSAAGAMSGNVATVSRVTYVNDPYQFDAVVTDG